MTYIQNTPRKIDIRSLITLAVIFGVLCFLPVCYLTLFPKLDYAICIPRAAKRVGAEHSTWGIYTYLREKIQPGMSREEIESILGKIGSLEKRQEKIPEENKVNDWVTLEICLSPFNDIRFIFEYSLDDKLNDFWMTSQSEWNYQSKFWQSPSQVLLLLPG